MTFREDMCLIDLKNCCWSVPEIPLKAGCGQPPNSRWSWAVLTQHLRHLPTFFVFEVTLTSFVGSISPQFPQYAIANAKLGAPAGCGSMSAMAALALSENSKGWRWARVGKCDGTVGGGGTIEEGSAAWRIPPGGPPQEATVEASVTRWGSALQLEDP